MENLTKIILKKKEFKGFLKDVEKYKINVDIFDFNIVNINMRNLQNNFLIYGKKK